MLKNLSYKMSLKVTVLFTVTTEHKFKVRKQQHN